MRKEYSTIVSDFLNLLEDINKFLPVYADFLDKEDKLCQDLLHTLELEKTTYSERAKIATKLVTNRKDRRYFKDNVQIMQDLRNWLENNKPAVEKLKQVLGAIRKVERYQKDREYIPKVLKMEGWENDETKRKN